MPRVQRYRSACRTLSLRNCPVSESGLRQISSGVPVAMMRPPLSPPSGPKSMTQSAFLMTSRLCSMTMTVLPLLVSSCRTPTSFSTSAKCRPVVGSSRMYRVFPAVRLRIEEVQGLLDRHLQHVGDGLALVADLQRL